MRPWDGDLYLDALMLFYLRANPPCRMATANLWVMHPVLMNYMGSTKVSNKEHTRGSRRRQRETKKYGKLVKKA